jgi:putative FmdB family regulatory protein
VPTYSYQCKSCDHEQDHSCRFSNRPELLECSECGAESKRVFRVSVAQSNDPYNQTAPKSTKTNGLVMHLYMCKDCENQFDELIDFSNGQHFEDKQKCPKCSSVNSKWVPMARIDRFSEMFPYYDRGLGVMLQSKQHRRDVCRERGLTPVDGDWNVDKVFSEWDTRYDSEVKEYDDYCDRLENHPAFRQFRESNDKKQL